MISNVMQYIKLFMLFLPFVAFQLANKKANYKKEVRYKQFVMPLVAFIYFILLVIVINIYYELSSSFGNKINEFLNDYSSYRYLNNIKELLFGMGGYIALSLINTSALLIFISIKKFVLVFFKGDFDSDTIRGSIVGIFYDYDEARNCWYLKKSCGQMRTFIKVAYYTVFILSIITFVESYELFRRELLSAPFCPVLVIIVVSELFFFIDGLMKEEGKSTLSVNDDNSRRVAMYALLRKPLRLHFGDKLTSEGTTINVTGQVGGAAEDVLASIEENGGHIGENYSLFMRKKIDAGLTPNIDYLRSGYDLSVGKSLLFNTPFYDKLIPYAFYAVNRCLLTGKNVLVVMGRHGTEEDIINWCKKGISSVTNVSDLYKISILSGNVNEDENPSDIGIISRSGVHDLEIHKANKEFLRKVGFVIIVEPSRLITTAQIGLNLLIKSCGDGENITFCSLDRNCDGLVDSLSHILMTNITEVSATEYPHGMSSFMCWKADDEHLQHRLFPGVSRYLGFGTELSFIALKNQVKETVWYGGDAYPVLDAHWISKQYYYDFLKYANLPTTQEAFDKYFKTSFNMCNESVSDYLYVTVEDERNNIFEARRNFATMAENQGFVNVISSEYLLREYMSDNTSIFTADAKAIPYITADYARTKRNSVLALCLLLCVGNVSENELKRKLVLMGIDSDEYSTVVWNEIYELFSNDPDKEVDKNGNPVIVIKYKEEDKIVKFFKDTTIKFKREYSVDSGKFENIYTIEDKVFAEIILDDLQNAGYIAEIEGKDYYIGSELKGHVYQKYLPGQLFTLNGKYYEMITTTKDNRIMIRRASEHINGRISYRQVRKYILDKIRNSDDMGALKTVNNIDIYYLYSDIEVETSGYWKLKSYNNFESGSLVEINGVPVRKYFNKPILKLDFSKYGEVFTDSIRETLTVLLNEVFVTLFAENQPFISAVTPGEFEIPSTYGLDIDSSDDSYKNSIFIIEDSQLDIGLLVAVERNLDRILHIISDYLLWNKDKIEISKIEEEEALAKKAKQEEEAIEEADENAEEIPAETTKTNKNVFVKLYERVKTFFKNMKEKLVKKNDEETVIEEPTNEEESDENEISEDETLVENDTSQEETEVETDENDKEEPNTEA